MDDESPLYRYAKSAKETAEQEIAKECLEAGISASPIVDRAASWLLVGIGATAALVIGNLEATSGFLGTEAVRILLLLLLAGGLFGLAQKAAAVMVQTQAHIFDRLYVVMPTIFSKHEKQQDEIEDLATPKDEVPDASIDMSKPINEMASIVPWYNKRRFQKNITKGMVDPLFGQKHAAKAYNRQVMYAVGELVIAIAAVLFVTWSI